MATPILTSKPGVVTTAATDDERLEQFLALRDSSNPHDADRAMRLAEELIERYMPLVGAVIRKWRARMPKAITIIGFEDLKAAGVMGLWNALLEFDPKHGTPFSTFGSRHISWAVADEMRRADFLKENARRKVQRSWRAVSALENRLGREVTELEAAEASGVSISKYRQLCEWDQRSLTAELTDPLVNYLSGSDGGDPLERLCAVEEALEQMPTEDTEIAASVREIRGDVESVKGYFKGDLQGAA